MTQFTFVHYNTNSSSYRVEIVIADKNICIFYMLYKKHLYINSSELPMPMLCIETWKMSDICVGKTLHACSYIHDIVHAHAIASNLDQQVLKVHS